MIKGIVIKVKSEYSIILGNGQYYRIKNKKNMTEGQRVIVTQEDILKLENKSINKSYKKYVSIAAVMLLMISASIFGLNIDRDTYALATIDINPSIELNLDKQLKVIKIKSRNKDGDEFEKLKIEGLIIDEALELIVEEAKNKGFIIYSEESYVLVTTVQLKHTDKSMEKQIEKKAKSSETLKSVNIAITNTTKEVYKMNRKETIPLGIKSLNKNIDKNKYKSLNEFFKEKDNIDSFKKNGKIIEITSEQIKKLKEQSNDIEKIMKKLKLEKEEGKKNKYSDKQKKDIGNKIEKLEDKKEDLDDKIEDHKDSIKDYKDKNEDKDDNDEDEDDDKDDDEDDD